MNRKNVCFTGYRPMKCPWGFNEEDTRCILMKKELKSIIEQCIDKGYNTFISGMALGFDIICAEIVLELKKKHKNIKLIGALPCENQDSKWNDIQKKRYKKILKKLDDIHCLYKFYIDGCMQERNKFMVDNSSLVIALYNGKSGGTKQTVNYAIKNNKEIIYIDCDSF